MITHQTPNKSSSVPLVRPLYGLLAVANSTNPFVFLSKKIYVDKKTFVLLAYQPPQPSARCLQIISVVSSARSISCCTVDYVSTCCGSKLRVYIYLGVGEGCSTDFDEKSWLFAERELLRRCKERERSRLLLSTAACPPACLAPRCHVALTRQYVGQKGPLEIADILGDRTFFPFLLSYLFVLQW